MLLQCESQLTSTTASDNHRCHHLPVVVLRVIAFDRCKPGHSIVSTDDIQQPVDNRQTYADPTRSHRRQQRPRVLLWIIPGSYHMILRVSTDTNKQLNLMKTHQPSTGKFSWCGIHYGTKSKLGLKIIWLTVHLQHRIFCAKVCNPK